MEMLNLLEEIALRASANVRREECDYEKDGILFCGLCNTPKQVKIPVLGIVFESMCLCKCATEKRDRELAGEMEREKAGNIEKMRGNAFPDAGLAGCVFDRDDGSNARFSEVARRYAGRFDEMRKNGKGLLLYGPVGTGKTFMAACIANALIDKGIPCLVTNFSRLTNELAGSYDGRQEKIDALRRYELLVIDDLGAERDTDFIGELVTQIIDARYRSGLPLIVTTNLSKEALTNPADIRKQRVYSRLVEMCYLFEVKGKNRRLHPRKETDRVFS